MRRVLAALACLSFASPAFAITGNAPPAAGWAARSIVMLIDERGDLCSGTALARDLVLTAAHCVARQLSYEVKTTRFGRGIAVRDIAVHPRFDLDSYARARATADLALIKLAGTLPDKIVPAVLAAPRRVKVGERLTIAGFGTALDGSSEGLGEPRMANLTVTGQPGSLQIRLEDRTTRDRRNGLGACTGDSGGPAFDGESSHHVGELIGVISWTTAPNNEEGCGGLTGLTPLLLYRSWIVDTARKFNSPLTGK
jgi:secreted trypsin-like serine protease